jgi:hypothetical protein
MGASPQQKAMEAAKQSVESAQAQQQDLYRDVKGSARRYGDKTMGQLGKLEKAAGKTLPEYIKAVNKQFGKIPTIKATQKKYEQALSGFDPSLIGSASDERLRQSLTQSAQQYAQGIGDVAGQVSGRLYETLGAPQAVFEDLASSAATNVQLDPMAMMMATRPKTIRSDVSSMKNLYTYNV